MFLPENDGVDHINIYSRGATKLGRALSNFAYADIVTRDGPFKSVEGYWYWLGTDHPDRDCLRSLHGFEAKRQGKELKTGHEVCVEDFDERIEMAIRTKVARYRLLRRLMRDNELPYVHYYLFKGFQKDAGHGWLPALAERVAEEIKSGAFEPRAYLDI